MASRNKKTDERYQPTKDSSSTRVNYDNESKAKFDKEFERRPSKGSSNKKRSNSTKNTNRQSGSSRPAAARSNSYFTRNMTLLEAAARVPSNYIAGSRIPGCLMNFATANVLRLEYSYTPVLNGSSILRQAMNDQYSFVVHANSRNYNYNPAALFTMELAGSEVYAALAMGYRVYGLMRNYSGASLYLPQGLIEACGFDFDDLRDNYAKMWSDLSQLVARAQQIWIPTSMSFAARWWELNTTIYLDSESINDQYYVFVPNGFHKLKLNTDGTYSLTHQLWLGDSTVKKPGAYTNDGAHKTWDNYKFIVNELIDAIAVQQDRGMIYGDLLNAYGAGNILGLTYPGFDFVTPLVHDMTTLHAIMNTTLTPFFPTDIKYNPSKDALYQVWQSFNTSSAMTNGSIPQLWIQDPILNFKDGLNLGPEMLANITRFTTLGVESGAQYSAVRTVDSNGQLGYITKLAYTRAGDSNYATACGPFTHGSEVVTGLAIFFNASSSDSNPTTSESKLYNVRIPGGSYYASTLTESYDWNGTGPYHLAGGLLRIAVEASLKQFDWRPIRYIFPTYAKANTTGIFTADSFLGTPGNGTTSGVGIPGFGPAFIEFEAAEITSIDANTVDTLNSVCLQSLAGVPISMTLSRKTGKNMDR